MNPRPMTDSPSKDRSNLTRSAVRGAAWTLSTSLGSRALGLIGTLLLSRYLAPGEYGEVSAASIVTATASSITTLGLGLYVVTKPNVSRAERFHATLLFVAIGVVALALPLLASDTIGRWSDAPDLGRYLPLFVLVALIDRVVYMPERMLVRELRFRWLSIARSLGEITYTVVSVGLAVAGVGAMAVVWGNLARAGVRFLLIVFAVDRREWLEPHRLERRTLVEILGFGGNITLAGIAAFGMRRWDNMLVSRTFGPAVMGEYNYAYNLADTPAVAVGEQLGDVLFASFPHLDRARQSEALSRSSTLIALIMFPLAVGLGAVAPTVVDVFFTARWHDVGQMLVFLSALSAPRPISQVFSAYFLARDRARLLTWIEWGSLIALLAGISTIGRLGILWTCGTVGVVFILRTLSFMALVKILDGVPLARFLVPLLGPLAASAVMAGAILAVRPLVEGHAAVTRLAVEIGLGALVYIGAALVLARASSRELLRLVRSALLRR
jgi:PST family polysaccharide transporter